MENEAGSAGRKGTGGRRRQGSAERVSDASIPAESEVRLEVTPHDAGEELVAQTTAAVLGHRLIRELLGEDELVLVGFEVLDKDILWHVPGRGPLSRDYRGHAEVLGFFQRFMELSEGTFRITVDDVLAKGDRVIALVTESARRRGREWSSPQVHAWTVVNGRATVFWQFQGDQQTEDEFWS